MALIFIHFHSITSWSIEFEDAIFPELAPTGRALSMGNAYISKTDDAAAVWYNPAGLGTVRGWRAHVSNLHVELNKGWIDMGTKGKFADAISNFTQSFDLDGIRKRLLENRGAISHSRVHVQPNFTSRYLSFGYLISKRTRATLGGSPEDEFEYADRLDHGPYAGVNLSLFGGVFKIGLSGILLNRNEAIDSSDANESVDISGSDYKKGLAAIVTTGVRLTLPIQLLPTFAAVVHNTLNQDFAGRAGGSPDSIKRTIDIGASITPQIGKVTRLHIEGNIKDITLAYTGVPYTRRIVAGMELDIKRTFFVRVGLGDGYGSGGLGIKSEKLEFDISTYAVDSSADAYRGKEDRRFAFTFSSGY